MPPGSFLSAPYARCDIVFALCVCVCVCVQAKVSTSLLLFPCRPHFRSPLKLCLRCPWANPDPSPRLPHPRAPAFTPTNRRTCYLDVKPDRLRERERERLWRGNTMERKREREKGRETSSTRTLRGSSSPLPTFALLFPSPPPLTTIDGRRKAALTFFSNPLPVKGFFLLHLVS